MIQFIFLNTGTTGADQVGCAQAQSEENGGRSGIGNGGRWRGMNGRSGIGNGGRWRGMNGRSGIGNGGSGAR